MLFPQSITNVVYWTQNELHKNLGDYLNEIMLSLVGIKIEKGIQKKDSPTYFGIGTLISQYWWNRTPTPRVIWGSAGCGFDFPEITSEDVFLCVRGPLTAKWLNLPKNVPLGDPALLMPLLYTPKKMEIELLRAFNYHNCHFKKNDDVCMKVTSNSWKHVINSIASADFVLANSLHSSILAHAFNRPWAIYNPKGGVMPMKKRWDDWLAYLGLPKYAFSITDNIKNGKKWWNKWKYKINDPNLLPIIKSCPWVILKDILLNNYFKTLTPGQISSISL